MSEPKRVLQVVTHMNRGGLETMLMNYYRQMDRSRVQFDFLTHREGEGYMEYIERVCENPLAARVKYADLQDNMDISRIPNPAEKDYIRLEKYKIAKARIEEALKG